MTNSMDRNDICMSAPVAEAMRDLRQFMFEHVYQNPVAKGEESKAEALMETLYDYFMKHAERMPEEFGRLMEEGEPKERVVCDYVAAMTDRFAINLYEEIFIPKSWTL